MRFVRGGVDVVRPFSIALVAGESAELVQPSRAAASVAARLCGAIVRPTSGDVFVGEFQTRLQPPQAKRLVGFVDARGFTGDAHAFACEIAFHAECWNLARDSARTRAADVVARISPGDAADAYARAIALALVADVALVVLDQPPSAVVAAVRALVPDAGLLVVTAR